MGPASSNTFSELLLGGVDAAPLNMTKAEDESPVSLEDSDQESP